MRLGGLIIMWVGIVALLKKIGFITVVDWSVIWPVALIIIGSVCRRFHHGKCGKWGMGKCGMGKCGCGTCDDGHKCVGPDCKECK